MIWPYTGIQAQIPNYELNGRKGGDSGYNSVGNHRAFGDRDIQHSMAGA